MVVGAAAIMVAARWLHSLSFQTELAMVAHKTLRGKDAGVSSKAPLGPGPTSPTDPKAEAPGLSAQASCASVVDVIVRQVGSFVDS